MANQVYEAARTVMAVREYQDKEVPEEALRRIVEAAHLTASASNAQPWHFILVRQRDGLRKLGSLIRTGPLRSRSGCGGHRRVREEELFGSLGCQPCDPVHDPYRVG